MALQDQPQNPPSMIDPATGQPYPYGSPGYEAAIAPWIQGQIKSQAEGAANARGTFYSGPAMADEIQAQQGALSAMAQEGAKESLQEKELAQQEQFASDQQKSQNQENANAAGKSNKNALIASAIGTGGQAAGTLGTLALYNHYFGPKDVWGTDRSMPMTEGPLSPSAGYDAAGFPMEGDAPIADSVNYDNALSLSPTPDFNFADAGTGVGPGAGSGGQIAVDGLTPSGAGMGALASLPAAYYGANAGLRTFGDTPGNKVAAGVGGAAGFGLGMLGGPFAPITMPLGAAAGSFLGPGIAKGGQDAYNWLSDRLHI